MSRRRTALKSTALAAFFSAVFHVLIPAALLRAAGPLSAIRPAGPDFLGLPFVAGGAWAAISCVMRFSAEGGGTPAPFDPPREMVVRGLYRWVRNPMYLGVFLVIFGEAVLFSSWSIFFYLLVLTGVAHLFVVFHEEPVLHRRFGAPYIRYCRRVNRWVPAPPQRSKTTPG